MNYKLIADTALLAGEIMLRSGAETYRVEDTISRILSLSNLERTESFVAGTGIITSIDDSTIEAITLVKRVNHRNINLSRIARVNDISRKLCKGELELYDAYKELKNIKHERIYKGIIPTICTIGTSSFFCALLGGNLLDCVCSGFIGVIILLQGVLFKKINSRKFISDMFGAFLIAIFTMILWNVLGDNVSRDSIIIGSIMPLLPGVAFTNAIRDTLQGDYMSGVSRGMEAIVVALSIGVGIGVGLSVFTNVYNQIFEGGFIL